MNQIFIKLNIALLSLLIVSCSDSGQANSNVDHQSKTSPNLIANGEDFVRQGLVNNATLSQKLSSKKQAQLTIAVIDLGDIREGHGAVI